MRAKKHRSFLAVLLILGIGIPGSIGIFVTQVRVVAEQAGASNAVQAAETSTPTPTLTQQPEATISLTGTSLPASGFLSTKPSHIYAYVQAPSEALATPYVILKAFSSRPTLNEAMSIKGFYNSQEFVCPNSACVIYLQSSSKFDFRAYSDQGGVSDEVIASVSVTKTQNGYFVRIDSVNQFTTFHNSCANAWAVYDRNNASWDDFVQSPAELNTKKTLHTLATQLLLNGIVDAKDCPKGGLSIGLNWPTACGLEKATPKMLEWQNQYDDYIWLSSRDDGIPPKILKTLIEIESQFWPGNQRFYVDEVGLGQINQLGVDVLLRRDPTLYQQVCPAVLSDCSHPYVSLGRAEQAMIRGAVAKLADATCPTCDHGLDLNKAKESVSLLGQLLVANCQQVDQILSNAKITGDEDVDAATATAAVATVQAGGQVSNTRYEDLWRFTFVSYHSGSNCLQQAILATKKEHQTIEWENVKKHIKCKGGRDYAEGFLDQLRSFDRYLYQFTDTDVAAEVPPVPTIIPTRTEIASPTPYVSSATVRVQVFMDRNGNKVPDEGEWIDAMSVLLTTSNGDQITQRTQNGITVFDMSGFTPGISVTVSLPGLYRSQTFDLPAQGEVLVTFMFEQPVLPTRIP
jgi:hypothetical protein